MGKARDFARHPNAITADPNGNVLIGTSTHHNFSGLTTEVVVGTSNTGSNAGGAVTFGSGSGFLGYVGFQETQGTLGTVGATPLGFNTNNTERMRIDSSGRVTMPYQPAFQATLVGPWSKSAGTQTVPFDAETFDVGGNFNPSTFRFTAPTSGRYIFAATVSSNSSSGSLSYFGIVLTVNGGTVLDGWNRQETSGYMTDSKTIVLNLSANDYVECKLETNVGVTIGSGNSTRFSGHLIG